MIITDEQGIAIAERLGVAQAHAGVALWHLDETQSDIEEHIRQCLDNITRALNILSGEEETIKE